MKALLLFILLPVVLVGLSVVRAARRALQMKLLVEDGVETTGRVEGCQKYRGGAHARLRLLRYEYQDGAGQRRTHRCALSTDQWDAHPEGGPIAVVYSEEQAADQRAKTHGRPGARGAEQGKGELDLILRRWIRSSTPRA